jgi:hypothetical protein
MIAFAWSTPMLEKHDRDALQAAVKMYTDRSPGAAEQIERKLRDERWQQVAEFCSRVMQGANLKLNPWEIPPAKIDLDAPHYGRHPPPYRDGRDEAAALLRDMLALGISRWHPDPEAAIAEAERQQAKAIG